ncbi:MAG TPA: tetratricopeptide repeat protein, partial [Myxococcales bacterium]
MNLRSFAAALAVCGLVGHRAIGGPDEAAVQAGALLAVGRPAEAENVARSCGEPRCRLVLGRALFAQGKLRDAASALGDAGELGPLTPYARVLQGEALLLSGAPGAALQPLRTAAASEGPVSIRAMPLLADALLALQDFTGAREAAERAGAFPGQPADLQAAMAWVGAQALLGEPGRAQDAAAALRAFWLRFPEHPAAETARTLQEQLGVELPEPSGRELLQRASRLLAAG